MPGVHCVPIRRVTVVVRRCYRSECRRTTAAVVRCPVHGDCSATHYSILTIQASTRRIHSYTLPQNTAHGPEAAFINIFFQLYLQNPQPSQFSVIHFLFSAIITFFALSSPSVSHPAAEQSWMLTWWLYQNIKDTGMIQSTIIWVIYARQFCTIAIPLCLHTPSGGSYHAEDGRRRSWHGDRTWGHQCRDSSSHMYLDFFMAAFQDLSGLSDLRDCPLKIGCWFYF